MSNMSYCRFENTANDLDDCFEHWDDDEELTEEEKRGKEKILDLCRDIVDSYGDEDDE